MALRVSIPVNTFENRPCGFDLQLLPNPVPEPKTLVKETIKDELESRMERLFINSFKVSGIKHIADNILQSVLEGLPQKLACN